MITHPTTRPFYRPRRNRKSEIIRKMVQETRLHLSHLIYPIFVREGFAVRDPIKSMPFIHRLSLDQMIREVEQCVSMGLRSFALFPVISQELKDDVGSEAINPEGLLQKAIELIKKEFPDLCLIADVALDPYTTHGHDGVINACGDVDNDLTVDVLVKMALVQASSGIDMVAPSDMMDGRVKAIRLALDAHHFSHVSIHAYTAKYASSFYGPFREALSSGLQKGNKKTYQMDPANWREALREAALDEEEGADILMVKPALPYLDIIAKLREITHLPISAYQVSGEYAMIMAADQRGWIDKDDVLLESLLCIKRAGASMIFTYAACQVATNGALD